MDVGRIWLSWHVPEATWSSMAETDLRQARIRQISEGRSLTCGVEPRDGFDEQCNAIKLIAKSLNACDK